MYQENLNTILLANDYLTVQRCLNPMSPRAKLAQSYLSEQLEKSLTYKHQKTQNYYFLNNILSIFR